MLEADERPLDVENVVADHVGLAVLHQEVEVVHGFPRALLAQHVADQAQVDVGCGGQRGAGGGHTFFQFFFRLLPSKIIFALSCDDFFS